jgi:hypothetical protein
MSTTWDPGAIGTAAFGAATLMWMAGPALVLAYKKSSIYVYEWRFPNSKVVRRGCLNDAPQDKHLLLSSPIQIRRSFNHCQGDQCWTTFLHTFTVLQQLENKPPPKEASTTIIGKELFSH